MKCSEDNYDILESIFENVKSEIEVCRKKYKNHSDEDIFTLSTRENDECIKNIASYLSSLKFTSYDCESSFSLLKRFKTSQRYSLSDENLRNMLFIKYNSKTIPLDFNQIDNCEKYKSMFLDTQKCYVRGTNPLFDSLLFVNVENQTEEEEVVDEEEEERTKLGGGFAIIDY